MYRATCRIEARKNCKETMLAVAELKILEAPETSLTSAYKIVLDAVKFDKLPSKSKPIAVKLSKNITSIKTYMKNGNAVMCKPEFMMIAINELPNSFTKKQLKQIFIDRLGWTDATAASHVSLAVPVLEALELSEMDSSGAIHSKIKSK
jgi:hypothetical protein